MDWVNSDLVSVLKYSNGNALKIKTGKTQFNKFGNHRKRLNVNSYLDVRLEETTHVTNLEFLLDENLRFKSLVLTLFFTHAGTF